MTSTGLHLSRRQLLRAAAGLTTFTAAAPLIAGCGRGGARTAGSSTYLRIGSFAQATGITLDPLRPSPGVGALTLMHLYDPLVQLRGDTFVLRLAEAVTANADATRWTIKVRNGARFHDGRPVRAADVAYSLRTLYDPTRNKLLGTLAGAVDIAHIAVTDDSTVQVPLHHARGDFLESMLATTSTIFPAGTTDFSRGIGSGPFRLDRLDRTGVRLHANPEYWDGAPRLPGLEIDQVDDATARLNGVTTGELDYAVAITATGARTITDSRSVRLRRGGPANSNALVFSMNQQLAPFNNPDVRTALRLIVDRQQLLDNALGGQGSVGNDLIGKGLPGYPTELPQRTPDLDRARQLLRGAGVSAVNLRVADLIPGLLDGARAFVQQAAEAGLRVTLQQTSSQAYFADLAAIATTPFQAFYYVNRLAATHLAVIDAPGAPFDLAGNTSTFFAGLASATATSDPTRRAQRFAALERGLYEHGGDIVWGFAEQLDAARPGLEGVTWSQSTPLFHQAHDA